jgi:hypothetical protein
MPPQHFIALDKEITVSPLAPPEELEIKKKFTAQLSQ